jgi:hypothetical protein
VVTPPTDTTRARAEAKALEILIAMMENGTPSQQLAAALAIHPRARPVDATPPTDAPDPHGFASLYVVVEADGTARALEDDEVSRVRHPPTR